MFKFSGTANAVQWLSELLPHIGTIADDNRRRQVAAHRARFNHDPVITYIQYRHQQPRRVLAAGLANGLARERNFPPSSP